MKKGMVVLTTRRVQVFTNLYMVGLAGEIMNISQLKDRPDGMAKASVGPLSQKCIHESLPG
jgi:hypothetical protein